MVEPAFGAEDYAVGVGGWVCVEQAWLTLVEQRQLQKQGWVFEEQAWLTLVEEKQLQEQCCAEKLEEKRAGCQL